MTRIPAPDIPVLRDVAVTRYEQRAPRFYGGIEEQKSIPEGRVVKGTGYRDIPQPIDREASGGFLKRSTSIPTLKGQWLFCGPLWSHFGHFFTDCIHRLWPLVDSPKAYKGVVFLAVKGLEDIRNDAQLATAKPPPYLDELLKLLDLEKINIQYIKQPTLIEGLAVPPAGTGLHAPVRDFYRPYLRHYQDLIVEKVDVHIRRAPERLYLGRSHVLHKGGILGSSYWEKALIANGFYSATPEAMRLPLQLGHLLGAKTVVMDEGSAAHPTQVFDRMDTEFFMLPRRPHKIGMNPFENMIGTRAPFTNLVERENMVKLPDRYGDMSTPAGLAVYCDPRKVFDDMAARGLLAGSFDAQAYARAEDADMSAADCNTPMIAQKRRDLLVEARAQRPQST
jgi:hypothetical protein